MARQQLWAGLDLGHRRTQVCVIGNDGAPLYEEECDTNLASLKAALSRFDIDQFALIAVEAACGTHLVRELRDAGFPVVMFESRKASKFLSLRRNKTDAGDAKGLADLGRLGRNTVSQVFLKSPECERLRSLIVMRKRLVHLRVAAEGALRSRMAMHGVRLKSTRVPGAIRHQISNSVAPLQSSTGRHLRSELAPLIDVCEALRAYVRSLDDELRTLATAHPTCRLLMEVPGVGPICAISFYTAIEDPARFRRVSDVAAYLGLVPRRYQSGALSRTLGITKTGSKLTRTHLVTAATVFGTRAPDCAVKQWYLTLRGRVGPARARVALARKLAIVLLTMWKNDTHFDAQHRCTVEKAPAPAVSG